MLRVAAKLHTIIVILLFPSENAKVVKKKPTCNSQKQLRTCANKLRTKVHKLYRRRDVSILKNLENKTNQEFIEECLKNNKCQIHLLLCINRKQLNEKWKHCLHEGDEEKINARIEYLKRFSCQPKNFKRHEYNQL
ncbi:hypothetical protein KSF78_0000267 [Schistosoma japonicum]|nr:hypothetical protein KSF78_0000267 [Schistosoma japonicum]